MAAVILRLFEAAAFTSIRAEAGEIVSLASEPLLGGLGAAGGARGGAGGGAAPSAGGELGAAVAALLLLGAAVSALLLPDFTRIVSIMPRSSWRRK